MATKPLPRPTVDVMPVGDGEQGGQYDVVISRDGKARSHRAQGGTVSEVVKDAIGKVLNDPYSAEWLP